MKNLVLNQIALTFIVLTLAIGCASDGANNNANSAANVGKTGSEKVDSRKMIKENIDNAREVADKADSSIEKRGASIATAYCICSKRKKDAAVKQCQKEINSKFEKMMERLNKDDKKAAFKKGYEEAKINC